jgi:hypothetical protein
MPIEFKRNRVVLRDVVGVEEAEGLLELLQKEPSSQVEFSACTHLHTANLQVLMAARSAIASWPEDPELRAWLEAALHAGSRGSFDDHEQSDRR